jgi:FlgN protein
MDTPLPQLSAQIEQRIQLLSRLAESLERSQFALLRNDAEGIARGAAHQAELCRQWSVLEEQLRDQAVRQRSGSAEPAIASEAAEDSARLEQEWAALTTRIRYLTRVHGSLLRHLQRSLDVLARVLASCAPTYHPQAALPLPETRPRAGE